MKKLLLSAAAILLSVMPANTQALTTYECYRLHPEQPQYGDQWNVTTQQFSVSAANPHDAIAQCTLKLKDEQKRANRRVLRT